MNAVKHVFLAFICFGALISCLGDSRLYAKETSGYIKDQHYWANLGGGFAWVHDGLGDADGGISGGMSLSYQNGGSLFSIRGVENAELKLDLWGEDSGPPDVVWDIGALYGRVAKASFGVASISGGLSVVGFSKGEGRSSYRPGIPIESQLFWTPSNVLGFGLYGFADLNSQKSFAGVLFCLQIGFLK
jgi:hypothetical protein